MRPLRHTRWIRRAIAILVIASCDLATAAINKAFRLQPIPSRDRKKADPIDDRRSPFAILKAPWPPGVVHRSIMEGQRLAWFMLRPGASTPPEIYLAYWKKRCNRKGMTCAN